MLYKMYNYTSSTRWPLQCISRDATALTQHVYDCHALQDLPLHFLNTTTTAILPKIYHCNAFQGLSLHFLNTLTTAMLYQLYHCTSSTRRPLQCFTSSTTALPQHVNHCNALSGVQLHEKCKTTNSRIILHSVIIFQLRTYKRVRTDTCTASRHDTTRARAQVHVQGMKTTWNAINQHHTIERGISYEQWIYVQF